MSLKGKELNINIDTSNIKAFYKKYIELIQCTMDKKNKLSKRELDILTELVHHSYLKRDIENLKDRFTLVFNISTRREIQYTLGKRSDKTGVVKPISNAIIQQALGGLRKKGYIKGINLPSVLLIEPTDNKFKLGFVLNIKPNEDNI